MIYRKTTWERTLENTSGCASGDNAGIYLTSVCGGGDQQTADESGTGSHKRSQSVSGSKECAESGISSSEDNSDSGASSSSFS